MDFKPHGGGGNLAVGEANAKGVNVTRGRAIKYRKNRVAVVGTFELNIKKEIVYDFRKAYLVNC